LTKIEKRFELETQNRWNADEDLIAPWDQAMKLSRRLAAEQKTNYMKNELDEIAKHVRSVYEDHRVTFSPKKAPRSIATQRASSSLHLTVSFTELPIETRQNEIRKISKQFVSFPPPGKFFMQDEEIARLRASYAYKCEFDNRRGTAGNSFAWDVAMRELGAIKARATGGHKTVVGEFYDHFNIKNPRN